MIEIDYQLTIGDKNEKRYPTEEKIKFLYTYVLLGILISRDLLI
jgi:hypothetical protein